MTSLDTIELTTHTDFIQRLDKGSFSVSQTITPKGQKIITQSLKNKRTGVNKITISHNQETITINASSKILGSNYPKGININTLNQFIDEVNNSGLILKVNFLDYAQLKNIHIKNDIVPEKEVSEYINTLNHLIAPKFTKTKYDYSIVFKEKIKTNNIYLTGYGKGYEIALNKPFYNEFPELIPQFDNILRIETKLPKKATILKYFNSDKLRDIISSTNFNHAILNKIIGNQTSFTPLINTYKMTNTQEKNFAQIYYLNKYYKGDFESIMNHIKSKLGKNTKSTYQRNKVKKYLSMINNNTDSFFENLEEIKRKLVE